MRLTLISVWRMPYPEYLFRMLRPLYASRIPKLHIVDKLSVMLSLHPAGKHRNLPSWQKCCLQQWNSPKDAGRATCGGATCGGATCGGATCGGATCGEARSRAKSRETGKEYFREEQLQVHNLSTPQTQLPKVEYCRATRLAGDSSRRRSCST